MCQPGGLICLVCVSARGFDMSLCVCQSGVDCVCVSVCVCVCVCV